MSENSKSLETIGRMVKTERIAKIAFFPTVLICIIYIMYIWLKYVDNVMIVGNLRFSSLILLIGGILTYILCLFLLLNLPLLLNKRKEPEAKRGILIMIIVFIMAILYYIAPYI